MKLNNKQLVELAEKINSNVRKSRRLNDYERYLMYHGKSKDIITNALQKDFTVETVNALSSRVVTLNITKKITNKLAGVYLEPPVRKVSDESGADTVLLNKYEDSLKINITMKKANRYFKLTKRMMVELFLDDEGVPRSRALPSHTYEVFSTSTKTPNRLDIVAVIKTDAQDPKEQVIDVWTKTSFYSINGKGERIASDKDENPYGALPYFYACEDSNGLDPIEDDDLKQMSIVIPVVLTDLLFGLKYQTFSMLYSVGVKGDIKLNPNTIVQLDRDDDGKEPLIKSVKAEFDSDKILTVVYNLVEMLLSVNNLSTPISRGSMNASNAVSGISKMIDSAEPIENKKDQQEEFVSLETEIWKFISKKGIPTWKQVRKFSTEFTKAFSSAFNPTISHQEPKALISEKEKVETCKAKRELKVITRKDVIRELNPDWDDATIDRYIVEIDKEEAGSTVSKVVTKDDGTLDDGNSL